MGGKDFIEDVGGQVKRYSDEDISAGFVIEPVHQKNKREKAEQKIDAVQRALHHQVAMVVTLY